MNIMLVSVTERTKEIGVRRACGARRGDILRQFLAESVVQCIVGGGFGVLVGFAVALLVRRFASFSRRRPMVGGPVGRSCRLGSGRVFWDLPGEEGCRFGPGRSTARGIESRST